MSDQTKENLEPTLFVLTNGWAFHALYTDKSVADKKRDALQRDADLSGNLMAYRVDSFVRQSDAARLIAELTQVRDTLRARLESLSPFPTEALASLETENAELRARLAELEKVRTEPVATKRGMLFEPFHVSDENAEKLKALPVGTKLYAAPPDAQAIIEGLTKERDFALGERDGADVLLEVERESHAKTKAEVERLTTCLKKANDQTEHFEREWYLRGDEVERLTAELAAFRSAVEHVTEDGKTSRSFSTSEGWAMVHKDRLFDLECSEERIAALEQDAARHQQVRRGQHWSVIDGIGNDLRAEELDAAIDAARKESQP